MKKDKKPTKKPGKLATFTGITIFLFFAGLAVALLPLAFMTDPSQAQLRSLISCVGWGIFGVSVIFVIIAIAIYRYYDKHPELNQPVTERVIERVIEKPVVMPTATTPVATANPTTDSLPAAKGKAEVMPDAVAHLDPIVGATPTTVGAPRVQYIPSMAAYEFINMGSYQSLEDKFDQISKMDHTQFVIYVARLFSRKGYQVKLTPVIDNFSVDLIVEKMGVTIAVGCILTNKVLSKEDIVPVRQGKEHYHAQNCMALTNMYFDRTALDFAREEKMSLVDRNILAEDFMN